MNTLKTPRLDRKSMQVKSDNNYKSGYGCDAKWVGNTLDDILSYMENHNQKYPKVLMELKQHLRQKGNDNTKNYKLWLKPSEEIKWNLT